MWFWILAAPWLRSNRNSSNKSKSSCSNCWNVKKRKLLEMKWCQDPLWRYASAVRRTGANWAACSWPSAGWQWNCRRRASSCVRLRTPSVNCCLTRMTPQFLATISSSTTMLFLTRIATPWDFSRGTDERIHQMSPFLLFRVCFLSEQLSKQSRNFISINKNRLLIKVWKDSIKLMIR